MNCYNQESLESVELRQLYKLLEKDKLINVWLTTRNPRAFMTAFLNLRDILEKMFTSRSLDTFVLLLLCTGCCKFFGSNSTGCFSKIGETKPSNNRNGAVCEEKEQHIIGTFTHKEQRAAVLFVLFRAFTEPYAITYTHRLAGSCVCQWLVCL